MASCKYGLEFAFALLTSTFYRHNEPISAGVEKQCAEPITAYSNSGMNNDREMFGLTNIEEKYL